MLERGADERYKLITPLPPESIQEWGGEIPVYLHIFIPLQYLGIRQGKGQYL